MANLTSTTITGTLNSTSTITGPGSGISAVNASNVSSGTLASDRLPTVPVSKGGTGLTSVGSDGQVLTVSGGGLAFQDAAGGGVGNSATTTFNSSGTFTAHAGTQFIAVEVIGGGGGGGGGGPNNSNPGNAGQSSTFGSFITATGGSGGGGNGGGGGSGGDVSSTIPISYAKGGTGTAGVPQNNPQDGRSSRPGGSAATPVGGTGVSGGTGGRGGRSNNFTQAAGGGGGAGGLGFAILGGPQYAPSQSVTVGSGGNAGSNGPQGQQSAPGSAGKVTIVEYIS